MFGIKDVETIKAVVDHGGFRAAATRLRIAQSAVSQRVAAVERRLGIQIFDRRQHRAILTPAGRRFLEESSRLTLLRDNIATLLADEASTSGTVRIGIAETMVHTVVPDFLERLSQRLPNMRFELSVDVSSKISQQMNVGELDVAFILRDFPPAFAEVELVPPMNVVWAATDRLALPDRTLSATDLVKHPIITFPQDSFVFRDVETTLSRNSQAIPLIHGCASLAITHRLVRAGVGVGTLPMEMVSADLKSGRLRALDVQPEIRLRSHQFGLYHTLPRQSSLGTALVDSFHAIFKTDHDDRF